MSSAVRLFDCADPAQRSAGIEAAAAAVSRGELVVLPTDTVYGLGADAFTPSAVTALLAAKGRGREIPPPVLVGSVRAATALIDDVGVHGQDLIDEFWPGALTLVCPASRTLSWDLGDTEGTVAVRMPLHPVALELLRQTGPLAVSSANRTGQAPAVTAAQAADQLGEAAAVYLDGGACMSSTPSSIVDLTGPVPRLLRAGAISAQRLRAVAPLLESAADGAGTPPPGAGGTQRAGGAEGAGGVGAEAGEAGGTGSGAGGTGAGGGAEGAGGTGAGGGAEGAGGRGTGAGGGAEGAGGRGTGAGGGAEGAGGTGAGGGVDPGEQPRPMR